MWGCSGEMVEENKYCGVVTTQQGLLFIPFRGYSEKEHGFQSYFISVVWCSEKDTTTAVAMCFQAKICVQRTTKLSVCCALGSSFKQTHRHHSKRNSSFGMPREKQVSVLQGGRCEQGTELCQRHEMGRGEQLATGEEQIAVVYSSCLSQQRAERSALLGGR